MNTALYRQERNSICASQYKIFLEPLVNRPSSELRNSKIKKQKKKS